MSSATEPTEVFKNMPPDDLAKVVDAVNVLTNVLLKALPSYSPEEMQGLTGDGIKPAAFRSHAHEMMLWFPALVNGTVSPERLAAIHAALAQLVTLLAPLERVVEALVDLRRVLAHLGNTMALDFYAGTQVGARLKQPDAMYVSQKLAPHHARARRKKDDGESDGEFDDSDDETSDAA